MHSIEDINDIFFNKQKIIITIIIPGAGERGGCCGCRTSSCQRKYL
jgi:hypothetical protein